MRYRLILIAVVLACGWVVADGPNDNIAEKVRPVPPPGLELSAADRTELEDGAKAIAKEIQTLQRDLKDKPQLLALLPDVQIYFNAIHYAVKYNEVYDLKTARETITAGLKRIQELRAGRATWIESGGARGYVSKIDGSVQPYILAVPSAYQRGSSKKYRFDFSCHGRGEKLNEMSFIQQKPGTPGDKFVVQLYGRYCNANKFAGEIDLLEVLEAVKQQYPVDENRLVITGFSMGGAACWQFAVHYTDLWAAAQPGAGFAETKEFLRVFQNEQVTPPWYQQKLWHWYDSTDYAANLFNLPTIAYSGEIDRQKQAADMMAAAMKAEGLELVHLIGPQTAHAYHKESKQEVDRRIDEIAAKGKKAVPQKIRFTTFTTRYNRMFWVQVDRLEHHWERARVEAKLDQGIVADTQNVAAITFEFGPGENPLPEGKRAIVLDGKIVPAVVGPGNGAWKVSYVKTDRGWQTADGIGDGGLHKQHKLQGPIDDAFLDSFIFVRPTGKPMNSRVGAWASGELEHAIDHWRKQFRGEARVKNDDQLTDADISENNIVLWGDPTSNKVLAKIADKLPIRWADDGVTVGPHVYPPSHHVLAMIYPNPLNPKRYVVLNSSFTFREYDYLNNARQVPKLPDYAVIDTNVPTSSRSPGGIVTAGFFGEKWELLENGGKSR